MKTNVNNDDKKELIIINSKIEKSELVTTIPKIKKEVKYSYNYDNISETIQYIRKKTLEDKIEEDLKGIASKIVINTIKKLIMKKLKLYFIAIE